MFFILPVAWLFWIYMLVALVPAFLLMYYVYQLDRVEPEPPALIGKLIGYGCISALLAMILEKIGTLIINHTPLEYGTPGYTIVYAFLVVGLAEEGMKFLMLYYGSWADRNFDYKFDGIVYAVSVSGGFAALENVLYVFGYGITTGVFRAFLSIPGHISFGVLMGIFYGRAKEEAHRGNIAGKDANIFMAIVCSILLHGIYDAASMIGTGLSMVVFAVVIIVVYIIVFKILRNEAKKDHQI